MQSGAVIIYREHGHLTLGLVQKMVMTTGESRVELTNEDGKRQVLPTDRILFDCKQTLTPTQPAADIKKQLQAVQQQIHSHAQKINVQELWELVQGEEVETWSWEDLAGLVVTTQAHPLETVGVLAALCDQSLYFKEKKAGLFAPRDAKSIEDTLHQQQVAQERAHAQGAFLAWTQERLATPSDTPAPARFDRYLDLLKGFALYGEMYDRHTQAVNLLEEIGFRGKGHPFEVAFQFLVAIGLWKVDEELSLLRYAIPTRFTDEVLQAAQDAPPFTPEHTDHTDLTSLFTFTIDDAETTDIDDALSISEENGLITVGIHIADASFFVAPGDVIDKAALARGTSVYMPIGRFPMLPPILSEEKASLVAGAVRPTLSFFASFDAEGNFQTERLCRGFITVGRRLTYNEADAILAHGQSESETAPCAPTLQHLLRLAQARKAQRIARGAIIIEGDEVKVRVHDDVVSVAVVANDSPSRGLVGECMILANEMAARYCHRHALPALYSAQPPPDESIPAAATFPSPRVYVQAARRSMKPSQLGVTPAAHSALALDVYTQATSPLRRYHDLQIQHQIKHHLAHGTALFDEEHLQMIAASAQQSTADAKRCERESTRYWLLRFLESRKGQTVSGQVVRFFNGRSFIELDDTLLVVPINVSPPLPLGEAVQVIIGHVDARRDILSVRLA
jgi:exoribonuclease-2